MLTKDILKLQQSHGGPALSGCWKLAPGRAISLQPRAAGMLRLSQGRVWATFDGPHSGHGNESGDHFLWAGQQLAVRAGQRLVLESWGEVPVVFEWLPLTPALSWAGLWRRLAPGLLVRRSALVC